MTIDRLVLAWTVTMALICGSIPADAQAPRVIVQTGHMDQTTAWAWTADSRRIVTGGSDDQLILWDREGLIIDKVNLPQTAGLGKLKRSESAGTLHRGPVNSLTLSPDGSSVTALIPQYDKSFQKVEARSVTWIFGAGRTGPGVSTAVPDNVLRQTDVERGNIIVSFPPSRSPDSKWTLEQDPLKTTYAVVKSVAPGVRSIALVGQAGLTDTALMLLADEKPPLEPSAAELQAVFLRISQMTKMQSFFYPYALDRDNWAVSPDGRRGAWTVETNLGDQLRIFNFDTAAYEPNTTKSAGGIAFKIGLIQGTTLIDLLWLNERQLMVWDARFRRLGSDWTQDTESSDGSKEHTRPLCFNTPVGEGGAVLGAGLANCRYNCLLCDVLDGGLDTSLPKDGLWLAPASGRFRAFDTEAFGPAVRKSKPGLGDFSDWTAGFNAIAVSSDGAWAAATYVAAGRPSIGLWDVASGRMTARIEGARALAFALGGAQLLTLEADGVVARDRASGRVMHRLGEAGARFTRLAVSPDGAAVVVEGEPGRMTRYAAATGEPLGPPVTLEARGRFGFFGSRPLFWTSTAADIVNVYSADLTRRIFTLYHLPDLRFLAVDPEGRYDSNLPPDSRAIRWLAPGPGLRSLAPQTYMRDYYEPGLMARLMACAAQPVCPSVRPVRSVASLNQVLPVARIAGVRPGMNAGEVLVDVEATQAVDPTAANAKTRSGVYDLRLFRDGKLVAQFPEPAQDEGADRRRSLETWRRGSVTPEGVRTFHVPLPSGSAAPVTFTAYAFNEDRVKGETATLTYARPTGPRRAPHAYVIAVGVDAAAEPAWNLHFAAADARAMATGLAAIPGYAVTAVSLVSTPQSRIASKANLRALLQLLTDGDAAARRQLDEAGLSTAGLNAVTPDDLVIISFSGHGWTDGAGAFYLVPGDGRRRPGTEDPDPASLVSSGELSEWLRGVDAGEMALIIDACHSAASVDAAGFKPGPMGDPGLGQLAYDKGIRVLAAAQADDVAQEDAGLRQGLLTYALVHDGLSGAAGDLRLDQWLRFGAERLPGLSRERQAAAAAGRSQSSSGIEVDDDGSAVQQPQLFDFTGRPSPVTLRRAGAAVPAGQGAQ